MYSGLNMAAAACRPVERVTAYSLASAALNFEAA